MEFKGKTSFREIDRNRVEYSGTEVDAWVQNLLVESAPQVIAALGMTAEQWSKKARLQLSVSAEKMGQDYVVRGNLKGQVAAPCSRCGDEFPAARDPGSDFNVIVQRVGRGQVEGDEDLDSGDPDFLVTDSDELDFIRILREQLIILEPMAECPAFDSTGKCSLCGIVPKTEASTPGQIFQKIKQ
jgi:uncharacterized metal-binding protein YceD (DUF177 family)